LKHFFGKMSLAEFQQKCDAFAANALSKLIRPKAKEEIEKLKREGVRIVIVSASPENWILQWAQSIQAELIATQLELQDGKLTGKILGKNCHGEEKVRRIKNAFTLSDFTDIFAYGDSSGDKPMLSLAGFPFMKPFR